MSVRDGHLRGLRFVVPAFAAASLLHHAHNAAFLHDYPNLPVWLARTDVYLAWLAVTAVGVIGALLLLLGFRRSGLCVLGLYGALGLDGLGHYALAPVADHTWMMNLTIALEVVTGALLLALALVLVLRASRPALPDSGPRQGMAHV
jgi:hypothetical protein